MTSTRSGPGERPWVATRHASTAPFRLICFPHAGASASMYRDWDGRFPPDLDVLAVQLPGRENRIAEPPIDAIHPLVDAAHAGLASLLDRPYALFGHSMGALLAYELIRRLRSVGHPLPEVLFVSGYPAPHLPEPADDDLVHTLDDRALIERMRSFDGTPDAVLDDPELCLMLLPAVRADFKVCETYRHDAGEPLPVDIVAFAGRDDTEAPPMSMAAWHELNDGTFTLHRVEGHHFFLARSSDAVIAAIAAHCNAARARPTAHGPIVWSTP